MMEDELGRRTADHGRGPGRPAGRGAAAVVRVGVPDRDRRGCARSSAAGRRPVRATPAGSGGGLVAHSLATALVTAGFPAVIGWDGSVDDRAATAFAERLYRALADRADLAVAVGACPPGAAGIGGSGGAGGLAPGPVVAGPGRRRPAGGGQPEALAGPGHPRHQDVPGPQAAGAGGGGGDVRRAAPGAAAGAAGAALR